MWGCLRVTRWRRKTNSVVGLTTLIFYLCNKATYTIEIEVTFKVKKALKGVSLKDVTLRTNGLSGSCGFPFKLKEKYLVYANGVGDGLRVSGCSKTKLLKDAALDFKEIKEGVELKVEPGKIIKSLP